MTVTLSLEMIFSGLGEKKWDWWVFYCPTICVLFCGGDPHFIHGGIECVLWSSPVMKHGVWATKPFGLRPLN